MLPRFHALELLSYLGLAARPIGTWISGINGYVSNFTQRAFEHTLCSGSPAKVRLPSGGWRNLLGARGCTYPSCLQHRAGREGSLAAQDTAAQRPPLVRIAAFTRHDFRPRNARIARQEAAATSALSKVGGMMLAVACDSFDDGTSRCLIAGRLRTDRLHMRGTMDCAICRAFCTRSREHVETRRVLRTGNSPSPLPSSSLGH